jgi:hypothetical protein
MTLHYSQSVESVRSRNLAVSWGIVYGLLWIYRALVSVVADGFVSGFTSLGDSGRYQTAGLTIFDQALPSDTAGASRVLSTVLTESFGSVLSSLFAGNAVLINLGFQTVAFAGIVVLLRSFQPRYRIVILPLLMLPSFTVWSSIASKEAIVVGALGFVLAGFVRMYSGAGRFGLVSLASLALVALYKPHYMPALITLIFGAWAARRIQQKAFLPFAGMLVSAGLIFVFAEELGRLAISVVPHFENFGSSRPPYFVEVGDFLAKAPYGMFQSFVGPTLDEASVGMLQMVSLAESFVILCALGLVTLIRLPTMSVFQFFLGSLTVFWILFATYPLSIMNAGSAIRYRTGYEMLILVVFVFFMAKGPFQHWMGKTRPASETRSTQSE